MALSIKDLYFKILDFEKFLYFETILDFKAEDFFESVIKKWIVENDYKNYISNISNKISGRKNELLQEDIWELYALSRVLDLLTLPFQTDNDADDSDWKGPRITVAEYIEFNNLLGLEITTPFSFKPFNCEIIEAQIGMNDFEIIECNFPAVKLNNLMIKKAGVKILLNPDKFNLNLINKASIYWAFRRKNRKYFDLSQGWGSNSQWRTDLRLDIETENSYIYNVTGKFNLNSPTIELMEELNQQDLELNEAVELTVFRHFMKCTKDDSDLFPYYFRFEEQKS
ncbi:MULTISPECIES: hypothetical protein [Acinetobacter]|jgi:hypothetical protein|uniref:hypothetical protein n=2 Tax=Moraxellaceae TaxID=468 RepID=UPI00141AA2A6|nr:MULTISPECIES: hypothetical protein [Acinetobacter]MCS4300011.1 hypothetical protein [Acinetobacter guillouiae]MCW2253411.1 hypothetical protein [Acinetobacter sp. BIGb0204]NII35484.1 hypothetical protein [Acinetobacter sp. BIGb0196]